MPAGVCGEMHTDHQGLWTQSSLQVLFSIRTLYSNQSFGFSLNTLCLLLPQNFLPSSPFYLHHPPEILQVWPLIVQLSSETSQLREKGPDTLLYVGLLHYVHHLPWFISGCYFSLLYFNTCSAECLCSLPLPAPTCPEHELRSSFLALSWPWGASCIITECTNE